MKDFSWQCLAVISPVLVSIMLVFSNLLRRVKRLEVIANGKIVIYEKGKKQ
jgi:hypothetical protein